MKGSARIGSSVRQCAEGAGHVRHEWTLADETYYCPGRKRAEEVMDTDLFDDEVPDRIDRIIYEWRAEFGKAYSEYGEGAADELGLAGQWGDLHRKIRKIKPDLWEGRQRVRPMRETPRQVLMDIMGHCLLAIDMIDRGMTGGH